MQCNSSPVSGASRKAARARCEEDAPPQVDSLTRPPFGVPWPVLEKRSKRALLRPTERPLYAFEATPLLRYQCSAIHHPCRAPLARLHERGVRRVPSRVHHARAPGDMRRLFAGGLLPRFRVTFTAGFRITSPRRLMSSRKLSSRYPTRRGHDVAESASSQVQRSRTGFGVVLPRFAIEARGLAQRQFAWPRLKRALI